MKIKTKQRISKFLILSIIFGSFLLPCYAENSNESSLLSWVESYDGNMLNLYAYYDQESNKIFSEVCMFEDQLPQIYCSYDNINFVLTEASEDNRFSFLPVQTFNEVYVKAVQTLDDGTTYSSNVEIVNIGASAITCADNGEDLGYIPDAHLAEPITIRPRNLPYMFYQYPEGSYFSYTGKQCTCHGISKGCDYFGNCDCISYYNSILQSNSIQCEGFAQKAYYEVHGKDLSSTTKKNTKMTVALAKSLFKTVPDGTFVGAYLRVDINPNGGNDKPHSICIILTTDKKVSVYHANYGGRCLVRRQTYTWEDFVIAFPYLYYYSN